MKFELVHAHTNFPLTNPYYFIFDYENKSVMEIRDPVPTPCEVLVLYEDEVSILTYDI